MNLLSLCKLVKNDESGAVTVDWVVLTAAIVGLAFVVVSVSGNSVYSFGAGVGEGLTTKTMTELSYSTN